MSKRSGKKGGAVGPAAMRDPSLVAYKAMQQTMRERERELQRKRLDDEYDRLESLLQEDSRSASDRSLPVFLPSDNSSNTDEKTMMSSTSLPELHPSHTRTQNSATANFRPQVNHRSIDDNDIVGSHSRTSSFIPQQTPEATKKLQLQYYKATRKAFREAYERQVAERALDSERVDHTEARTMRANDRLVQRRRVFGLPAPNLEKKTLTPAELRFEKLEKIRLEMEELDRLAAGGGSAPVEESKFSATTLGGYPSTQPSLAPMATFGSTTSFSGSSNSGNNGNISPGGSVYQHTITGADGTITVVDPAGLPSSSPLGTNMGRSISPSPQATGRSVTPLSLPALSPSGSTSTLAVASPSASASTVPAVYKGTLGVIVSCDRLIGMDHFGQTDPCCCVYEQNQYLGEPAFFARTETLINALAPRFTRHLLFEFDSSQPAPELEFRMYDIERDSQKELIGLHRATAIDFAIKLRARDEAVLAERERKAKEKLKKKAKGLPDSDDEDEEEKAKNEIDERTIPLSLTFPLVNPVNPNLDAKLKKLKSEVTLSVYFFQKARTRLQLPGNKSKGPSANNSARGK